MTDTAFTHQPEARDTTITKTVNKSASAYRTISEAADELAVPQHVLRFWETKFSQIRPMKRSGGRRFYRPEDIAVLQTIKHLLYDQGYTIKGVQRLLKLRRGVGMMDAEPIELPDAPEMLTLKPQIVVKQPQQPMSPQSMMKEAMEMAADNIEQVVEELEADLLASDDLFAQIPEHLPAKPAMLMATGLMEGNPVPHPEKPVEAAPQAAHAAMQLTGEQHQQLSALLAELRMLKTMLN